MKCPMCEKRGKSIRCFSRWKIRRSKKGRKNLREAISMWCPECEWSFTGDEGGVRPDYPIRRGLQVAKDEGPKSRQKRKERRKKWEEEREKLRTEMPQLWRLFHGKRN
jgi:hypothetical protein